jgi:hypothetical protein
VVSRLPLSLFPWFGTSTWCWGTVASDLLWRRASGSTPLVPTMDNAVEIDPRVRAVIQHWKGLMPLGARMPTAAAWRSGLSTDIAPWTFRVELLTDDALVLFMGSEITARRGESNEGRSLFSYRPEGRPTGMRALRNAVLTPCAYWFQLAHPTTEGRTIQTQGIMLPLATEATQPPQVVGYSVDLARKRPNERFLLATRLVAFRYEDLGFGVPAAPLKRA